MSYILDALRRAEAERERGSVPGLHSQTVPPATPEPAPRSPLAPWAAAGVGGAVVLVGAAGWFWLRPGSAPAPAPVDAAPIAAAPAMSAIPAITAIPPIPPTAAPAPTMAAAPAATPPPLPARPPALPAAPAPVAAAPAPPPRPVATPARPAEPAPAPPSSSTPPEPAPTSTPTPAPAPPPRAEARVINFDQLPEDVRRAIPPLVIGGAIYSENAASRMLIVGGQLLREGESAGPGVTLEQIKPRSAILRWKQLRYEVTF